mgnify:CR=1 FL=1
MSDLLVRIVFYQPHTKFLGVLPEDQTLLQYHQVGYCDYSGGSAGGDGVYLSHGKQKVFRIGKGLFTIEAIRQLPQDEQCELTPGGMIKFVKYDVAHWVATPFVDGRIGDPHSCANPRFFRSEMKPLPE